VSSPRARRQLASPNFRTPGAETAASSGWTTVATVKANPATASGTLRSTYQNSAQVRRENGAVSTRLSREAAGPVMMSVPVLRAAP
jgi:hypothetical protein